MIVFERQERKRFERYFSKINEGTSQRGKFRRLLQKEIGDTIKKIRNLIFISFTILPFKGPPNSY